MSRSISVEGLSVDFTSQDSNRAVLHDVSFEVRNNEFVVIIGPSGCGKTTLLKTLAGTVKPTAGQIRIGGTPIQGPHSDVAMVFQEFVLLPWKTVVENVAIGLRVQEGLPCDERREIAHRWIETVGLEEVAYDYPGELSGGMKQRAGLARALAVDPDVLLMDEPFGSLDAQTRDRLQTELLELWDREKTVVFVTHDIDEALFLGDRVIVLSDRPASISAHVSVNFTRPRWDRRIDIEKSEEFAELKHTLREHIGLAAH